MNDTALIQKVWNYATVLRNEGVHYGAYISQISFLLFLKMDDEAVTLVGEPSVVPNDCRWSAIKDLQGEALAMRYNQDSRQAVAPGRADRHDLPQGAK